MNPGPTVARGRRARSAETWLRMPVAILPLFVSGCFSALNEMGSSWEGGSSRGAKAVAGGLDVVTAPIQVPVLAASAASKASTKEKHEKARLLESELVKVIAADPSVALREDWAAKSDSHYRVFLNSFSDDQVRYTPELLEEIYDRVPSMRDYLFRSKACTTEFLVRHFDEAYDRSFGISYTRLASIVSNPNTPLPLVEKVARSETIPGGAVQPARNALAARTGKSPGKAPGQDGSTGSQPAPGNGS